YRETGDQKYLHSKMAPNARRRQQTDTAFRNGSGTRRRRRPESANGRSRPALRFVAFAMAPTLLRAQFYDCGASSGDWPVDEPSLAYSWTAMVPQSCECAEVGVKSSSCDLYTCSCTCDVTAGKCDYNCCCDPECSSEEVARFTALDACLPDGTSPTTTVMCYDKGQLREVNPHGELQDGTTAQQATDGLLCVQFDNSESKGDYYADPGDQSSSALFEQAGEPDYAYKDYISHSEATLDTEGGATLDKGDRIPAAFASGLGAVAAYGGFMPLPVAGNDGGCNERSYLAFEIAVTDNACTRRVFNLTADCAGLLGGRRFGQDLYVGEDGTSAPSASGGTGGYVPVTVSSVTWRDWDTGAEFDFSDGYNCDAFYFDGSDASSSCTVGTAAGSSAALSNATVAAGCVNALVGACYTVWHDGDGAVTAVEADLTVTNVPATAGNNAGDDDGDSTDYIDVQQSFTVQFRGSADVARSGDLGNFVNRSRSGNPGYLVGLPVLSGTPSDSGTYVAAAQSGLQILGGGDGTCDSAVSSSSTVAAVSSVLFGYDILGCCALALTRVELEEMCSGGGPHMSANGATPTALNLTQSLIGAFGNADPLDPGQWLALEAAAVAGTALWDDVAGACNGVAATLDVRLLHTRVGPKASPQSKIVAVSASYSKDDWVWATEDGSGGGGSGTATQTFVLCAAATFVAYQAAPDEYTPPPPPVALTLPWDLFYPFSMSAA
ncbi:unnamed protein product, partial [Phaeothamnion confervicola]